MHILSTHHIALYTRSLERLRDFYVRTLGLPVVGAFAEQNIVFIGPGSTTIELTQEDLPSSGSKLSGWNHIAWEVENVDEAYAELKARGVSFHVPPEDFPADDPSFRIAFFKDPDGNVIELIQPLGGPLPRTES